MFGRLLIGIIKGLIVGGLVGVAVAKLGYAAPGAVVAYLAAAVTGVLIGLIAGKPIWAKDAKIEAGMKAFVGALLAAGLMYAARRWLTMPVPLVLGPFSAANESLGEAAESHGTLGGLAVTSLAALAALLGGFYDADNDSSEGDAKPAARTADPRAAKRIAAAPEDDLLDEEQETDAANRMKK